MFEGLRRGPAPGTERGEVAVEPGGVGGKVAFPRPHLMNAACKELGETHKGVEREGGRKGVPSGGRGHGGPLTEEDGPGFHFHRRIQVRRRARRGYGEGGNKMSVEKGKQGTVV